MNKDKYIDNTNGHLDEVLKFAATQPNGESLINCFNRLAERWAADKDVKILIHSDWALHSFGFTVWNEKTETAGLCGGIIYHESMEVPLWSVHT